MAALRLSRRAGSGARVTVVNGSDGFVERIRLHQLAAGQTRPVRSISKLLARRGATLRCGQVRAIDPERRTVDVDGQHIGYDSVVLALGSHTDRRGVPGAYEHAHTLDPEGQARLRAALGSLSTGARVVVAGGGLTAIEAASEIAESFAGVRVMLVSAGSLAQQLSGDAQGYVRLALTRLGVEVVENSTILAVEPGRVSSSAGRMDCDLCLWAAGFRAHPLIEQAGVHVNERGQAWVDRELRALGLAESTWVVGDAAAFREPVGAPIHMTCKTALPMGAQAADNIARSIQGAPQEAFSFGDTGYCVSLGRRDAVMQLTHRDGTAGRILKGRWAAFFKEQICAYTVASLWLEAHLGLGIRWFEGPTYSKRGADNLERAHNEPERA
jgi:NADH dehydrogenase FAD-containing subunit